MRAKPKGQFIRCKALVWRADGTGEVVLMLDGLAHVQKPENDAEVELVAAVLDALQAPVPEVVSRDP